MFRYIAWRLLYAVPVLLGVSLLVFFLAHAAPGDIGDLLIPPEAPLAVAAQLRASLGLDRPLWVQYPLWLGHVLQGDFGVSVFDNQPIGPELFGALRNTFYIAIPAVLLGAGCGICLGAAAAFRHRSKLDKTFSFIAITGVSLPHYWGGIILVAVFSVMLGWLPAQGMGPAGLPVTLDQLRFLVLPVITLSLIPMGVIARMVRTSVLDVLHRDFVEALYAKGLTRRRVLVHIAKNAAPSIIALLGLQFGYLLGGSILVETVFNWPGSGNLLDLAIFRRDVPMMQATILVIAAIFVTLNIAVDILHAAIDPRLRREA